MKFLLISLALIVAIVAADNFNEYLPPVQDNGVVYFPMNDYLPPVQADVPTNEYLPPIASMQPAEPAHVLADDGYHYKTVRRLKYRHRRDVNELPPYNYVSPSKTDAPTSDYLAPVIPAEGVEAAIAVRPSSVEAVQPTSVDAVEPAHVLADDGYRYKTIRRLKYRHRRDVSELPTIEYLPPVQADAPTNEYLPPVTSADTVEPAHILADDGYRYKTVRRLKYRHRRDVSELPTIEYLPPVQADAPTNEYLPPVASVDTSEPAHILADDGYHYKSVRRLKYRRH